MRIAVIGTGYVGLVTGTCFAETGNDVTCVDIDQRKIDMLQKGEIPIYEPGLAELVERNASLGKLTFTTDLGAAVREASVVYLAVGTPQADDGSADLTNLWAVVDAIAAGDVGNAERALRTNIRANVPAQAGYTTFERKIG